MAQQIDLDRIAETLKLSPAQRARLEQLARTAATNQTGGGAPEQARPEVALRIHFTPGASLRAGVERQARTGGRDDALVSAALARLPPKLRETLQSIEPQVLRWINASPANALLFASDPVGALRKAVPRLDAEALSTITRLRSDAQRAAASVDIPGLYLSRVTVDAKVARDHWSHTEAADGAVKPTRPTTGAKTAGGAKTTAGAKRGAGKRG